MSNFLNTDEMIADWEYEDDINRRRASRELVMAFMQDAINRESGKVVPDTTGADKYFVDSFITGEMSYDFGVIAREFMKQHFAELGQFDRLATYRNAYSYQSDPERALQIRILSIMYKAARSGDAYAVELIKNLYKTYHKKEYKQLKRFSKISVNEIFSLSENPDGSVEYEVMARILGMCSIYGIQLEDACSVLYIILEKNRESWDEDLETDFFEFPDGMYQQCLEQVEDWILEAERNDDDVFSYAKEYWKTDDFVVRCLARFGYPENYVYRCDKELEGLKEAMAKTLALLKSIYPRENFSYTDVQRYTHIYRIISALVSVSDAWDENIGELFGLAEGRHELDEIECLFKPENIAITKKSAKPVVQKPINLAPTASVEVAEKDYLNEIAELRRRLHDKEQESKHFRSQFEQARVSLKETKEQIEQYKNDRVELIALRNYVYHLSEDNVHMQEEDLHEMMKQIANHNVVIVGGHVKWVNKLKKQFPKWKFFDANITRVNEAMLLEGTERLYFYTNHLSHGTYGIYISMVRENKIPFGYLHSVNMETMTRQIYNDLMGLV